MLLGFDVRSLGVQHGRVVGRPFAERASGSIECGAGGGECLGPQDLRLAAGGLELVDGVGEVGTGTAEGVALLGVGLDEGVAGGEDVSLITIA